MVGRRYEGIHKSRSLWNFGRAPNLFLFSGIMTVYTQDLLFAYIIHQYTYWIQSETLSTVLVQFYSIYLIYIHTTFSSHKDCDDYRTEPWLLDRSLLGTRWYTSTEFTKLFLSLTYYLPVLMFLTTKDSFSESEGVGGVRCRSDCVDV